MRGGDGDKKLPFEIFGGAPVVDALNDIYMLITWQVMRKIIALSKANTLLTVTQHPVLILAVASIGEGKRHDGLFGTRRLGSADSLSSRGSASVE
jgi:hypothetical protein